MANDNSTAHPANQYDAEIRRVIPFYDAIRAETLDVVRTKFQRVTCWVDTGCGTGSLIEPALAVFPGARFLLADPSPAMLAEARKRFQGKERVEVLAAGGSDALPQLVRRPVDVVTAILCHHYLDTKGRAAALRGCFEILAPGGLLVVFENTDAESEAGRRLLLDRWKNFQLNQGRPPADVESHLARFGAELKPIPVSRHFELLRSTGFDVVELFWRAHAQAGFYAIKAG